MSKYSIGLDIGTNSVGWAVVDENNELVKKNGFTLWGVRMFDEAKDASETRSHRTDRRRLARRKYRIKLLRDIFNEEIIKIDPTFFERLDDSFYRIEDKRNANYHNLFNDQYTDKQFFSKFPTIYHLRKYLCESNQKEDIRFIYLALHHMIKYRGNFLYQGETFNKSDDNKIKEILDEFNVLLKDLSIEMEEYSDYFQNFEVNSIIIEKIKEILLKQTTKNDKKRELKSLFQVENKTLVNEYLIPLLIGSKCNISSLTPVKYEKYEKCELTVYTENIEQLIDEAKTKVPELYMIIDFLSKIKELVDYYFLIKLLQDGETLSDAMIKKYDEHNHDLTLLKQLIKQHLPSKYNECFRRRKEKLNNYVSYVGFNSTNANLERFGHCSRDEFYSYLQSLFKQITVQEAEERVAYFLKKIENNDLLLRQNSDQNGSLPMQLNLSEMITILDRQSRFYPFLEEEDNGITNEGKIISIFKFIVPYYVGPLNKSSNRSWLVRTNDKIYPWNFDKVIDIDESAIRFIQNMQRKCTYLKGETDYCLPKKSIIFSKYNCLSYLNKLNINGSLISPKIKQDLFENVFLQIKKPTKKNIINYLKNNYGELNVSTSNMKELPEINCDMSSYIKFTEIFEGNIDDKIELIEQIIKDIVIFSDKKILEKRLYNVYKLEENIVKKIKDLNYKDYSSLSNNLLNGVKIKNSITGEIGTVIEIMYQTNYNLQEILYSNEYRLIDIIDEYNKKEIGDIEYENVEEFLNSNVAVSPIMKRPLIQAYTIIQEVKKILNAPIDKYYVECTRTNKAEKKQTQSRYNHLTDLYASCKEIAREYNINLSDLEKQLEKNQDKLKSDLIYLYFTQLGKCMYTMKDINIEDLFNNNKWDIDHIYPQALVKDDSFSNKVLADKTYNNRKQDKLLFELDNFLNPQCYKFYEKLKDLGLITKEKFKRLTKTELLSNELEVFVNRQLVSTNQAVKGLIEVLKICDGVPQTNIVYSKAENISLARQLFELPKSRLANNYHHAHDAYLNVVIGRVINDYFVKNHFNGTADYYRLKAENKTINVERILNYNYWLIEGKKFTKDEITKLIEYNLYKRYDVSETTQTYNPNSLFSKVTIQPANKGTVPMKLNDPRSDISKYGGITSYSYCKYIIVETINKKGEKEYILEAIPKAFDKKEELYLCQQGFNNFKIVHNNIKANVVIKNGPLKYSITGKFNDSYYMKNLNDRFFRKEYISIIKKIEKYNNNVIFEVKMNCTVDYIILSPAKDHKCNEIRLYKEELILLYNEIIRKFRQKTYHFSPIIKLSSKLNQDLIKSMTVEKLIIINNELLNLLQTNARKTADLTLIGESKNYGVLSFSKKLKPGVTFISESVTGYYHKVLFEVK